MEGFASYSLSVSIDRKCISLLRVQSCSHKTFNSQSAKDFKDANIDIDLGEFTEGKTASQCILSLLKENSQFYKCGRFLLQEKLTQQPQNG